MKDYTMETFCFCKEQHHTQIPVIFDSAQGHKLKLIKIRGNGKGKRPPQDSCVIMGYEY
jgi:hypothetical protein